MNTPTQADTDTVALNNVQEAIRCMSFAAQAFKNRYSDASPTFKQHCGIGGDQVGLSWVNPFGEPCYVSAHYGLPEGPEGVKRFCSMQPTGRHTVERQPMNYGLDITGPSVWGWRKGAEEEGASPEMAVIRLDLPALPSTADDVLFVFGGVIALLQQPPFQQLRQFISQ